MMSSLSALLVTAYIRNLIKFSASFHDYYKSYYIANAWLELALVKTNGNVRWYGFEDVVSSWSSTVTANFSGSNRYFFTTIKTTSWSLWDANTSNPWYATWCNAQTVSQMWYQIPPWWCVPIVLLQDKVGLTAIWQIEWSITKISDNALTAVWWGLYPNITIYSSSWFTSLLTKVNNDLSFADWWSTWFTSTQNGNVILNTAWQWNNWLDGGGKYILMIANTSSQTWYYCASSNVPIPTQYVTISAEGNYGNVTLNLKWVRKAWLPSDFCYTAISQ